MSAQMDAFFAEITNYISQSRACLREGREHDLAGFEVASLKLVEQITGMSDAARVQYAEQFEALVEDLRLLAQELTERRGEVYSEIQGLNQRQKAGAAYRTADASTDPIEE